MRWMADGRVTFLIKITSPAKPSAGYNRTDTMEETVKTANATETTTLMPGRGRRTPRRVVECP